MAGSEKERRLDGDMAEQKIAILGAGIVGLSTALTLANRGHNVAVYDPEPASGATWHAGGMLAPAAEVGTSRTRCFR